MKNEKGLPEIRQRPNGRFLLDPEFLVWGMGEWWEMGQEVDILGPHGIMVRTLRGGLVV